MCGIVGLVAFRASATSARAAVCAMNEQIAHRGPDGEGIVVHPDATLAMKRLAIVDVVHGAQPMATEDDGIVLVYNGEIYNAPALRKELERDGVAFRTRSDTEVILRLYERNPDDVERHLVGMWAFAIHDRKRRRVVLSRDRFGIKPLFVADSGTALAFASELRCFDRSLTPFQPLFELDHAAAHAMMSWSFTPEDSTIYRGVRRLPPASRLTIDLATGKRRVETYWRLEPSPDAARVRSLDEACEGVEPLLSRAVREHLESDVPIATFLSGGVDSSLVTAYASEHSSAPIKAYSIGFSEPRYDESQFAREVADRIGVPIVVERFDEEAARARMPDALLAYDEPFGDSSSLATFLLAAHVGRDYKVALGGDGGDEIFAGYTKYRAVHLRRPWRQVPRLREVASLLSGRLAHVNPTFRRLSRALGGSDAEVFARLTQVAPLARTAPLMRVSADPERYEAAVAGRFERAFGNELQRSLATDLAGTLTDDMLVKVDRASMACHLEARVPFLDHRVAAYGVGLPAAYTLGRIHEPWQGKVVLRRLYERRFGSALANRKKMGFGVPIQKWLRGPFAAACERLFSKARLDRFGVLASDELDNGGYKRWLEEDPNVVWHAFALATWCEVNLGDGPAVVRELLGPALHLQPRAARRSSMSGDRIRQFEQELIAVFRSAATKHAANVRAKPLLEQASRDPAFLRAVLAQFVQTPGALDAKNYPVVGIKIALNPWFALVANCWIPLPDRATHLSTKAIHHHGDMLLSTATIFGPGYEHWMFSLPKERPGSNGLFDMKLLEAAPHPLHHVSFVDAWTAHTPLYPQSLSITLALWTSRHRTSWKDHLKRLPIFRGREARLRQLAIKLRLKQLELKVVESFDYFPEDTGFRVMKERKEFELGPNEDHCASVFHILQETGNEQLATDVRRALSEGRVGPSARDVVLRLTEQLERGTPIEGRLSKGHFDLPYANFTRDDIRRALTAGSPNEESTNGRKFAPETSGEATPRAGSE